MSQVMVDKIQTVKRTRIRQTMGNLPDDILNAVDTALVTWVGLQFFEHLK